MKVLVVTDNMWAITVSKFFCISPREFMCKSQLDPKHVCILLAKSC